MVGLHHADILHRIQIQAKIRQRYPIVPLDLADTLELMGPPNPVDTPGRTDLPNPADTPGLTDPPNLTDTLDPIDPLDPLEPTSKTPVSHPGTTLIRQDLHVLHAQQLTQASTIRAGIHATKMMCI